jgi:diguanylate cyclase (GGDEF)-like protein
VLLVGIVLVVIGRRRSAAPGGSRTFDRLLDAGRRMASALDRSEIATIAVTEASKLAHARIGAFIDVEAGHLALAYQNGELVDPRRLGDGVLSRVAATGRAVRLVSKDEPAITALPAALLAVPVIGQGSVTGIVLLVRPDDAPFSDPEEDVVGRLAPMIGSALAAADTHGDITELTRTDALTGLANRRSLDADLATALVDLGGASTLGVVMVDVDHFKHFNDTNGHAAGDQALRAVAGALRDSVRTGDVAYRYGGEEFSLLLRDVSLDQALEVAERVRRAVESISVVGTGLQPDGRLTISLGVALVAGGSVDDAIAAADAALYEAKESGRNRIAVAAHEVPIG